ncbi:MAG: F0F1 ATP synthase subunit delta [Lachnospiraceae bacterium]|jgi:F-type H+-transporting ATPase subunit delta|nr:F0F1 ATP synthase subunit delta [Lachnospiraceae bacterium]
MAKLAANVYGEALFELAMEDDSNQLLQEAQWLLHTMQDNPDMDQLMLHPAITKTQKMEFIKAVFGGKISKEMEAFLYLLISKERYKEYRAILTNFSEKIKEAKKIGTASVITAFPLSEEMKEKVLRKLLRTTSYEEIDITYSVDEKLIGGIVIQMKDRVVDGSVQTKLHNLSKQLSNVQV